MRVIRLFVLLLCLGTLCPRGGAADNLQNERPAPGPAPKPVATSVGIRAMLVVASNGEAEHDARLANYEPTLRRLLRFECYRLAGEGSSTVPMPGSNSLGLGGGHRLELEAADYGAGQTWTRVRWIEGHRLLMDTILIMRRGVPAVLGGPTRGGETLAVILITR